MTHHNTFVVIMAGGIGSRFWPFSRTNNPKQFHDVLGIGTTMLQMTVNRFREICPLENILIVTNADYRHLVQEQIPDLPLAHILCEPIGRNTSPAIAYACYKIYQLNPQANIVVAPADHVILKEEAFKQVVGEALQAVAREDVLVTLGITPTRPDTGYGYIQFIDEGRQLKKVKTFTEKPNLDLAKVFVDSGDFVWNAGIFIWNVKTILHAFRTYLNEIAEIFEEGAAFLNTDQECEFINRAYSHCRNVSIDYGIMEKADNVYVILSDLGWSDLGTWNSLYSIGAKDEQGNVVDGDALLYETNHCIIKTPQERLVVIQGLENFIVAEYDNVLLICQKEEEQRIKDFVAEVKTRKGPGYC
ncbi:MAG: mannose-1-phosphate guanylyltransferase [Adhaeribacter sp.]